MADELNESELANTCRMRNSKSRNFYAANLLRWEADERSKPVQSPFVRCKEARTMLGGRSILERCQRAGWITRVRWGKRLTFFKRADIEAAQLRLSWGELSRIGSIVPVGSQEATAASRAKKTPAAHPRSLGPANPLSDKILKVCGG